MNTEKVVKEAKVITGAALIVGVLLLAVGILFGLMDNSPVTNYKALIGLSVIPFSAAFAYFIKLTRIKRSPQKMRKTMVQEVDERLVAWKHAIDARSFRVLQGALFLVYMGNTLIVPEDIFKSFGWWGLLSLLFLSFISQGVLSKKVFAGGVHEINEDN
ncbi:hypothetical protein GCM10008018_49490 [Paenibacillus marchantiophytorum]|uniref:DUF2178 domain-containing protein n=1 Tax=Paenibacillus marchantiophytorum TaxID=1619310 RepID=A0ABQ1F2B5_9BACL|nr:hypothetical protein [Paenibacillus marchantiophytorum]GFZ97226.1 hypothetical protein GCM10008018_49490 [Paenibacillus marchantiophytorum]